MYQYADIQEWSRQKLSDNEVPLTSVAEEMQSGSSRFDLKPSKQAPNSWTIWDNMSNNVVVITHAFVIRWTSPLDSGNFVPEGCPTPENLNEAGRRSEPGPNAQLSIAFDTKMDDSIHKSLSIIDKWVSSDLKFNPSNVPRSQWMTPAWIANNGKFIVNSQLFAPKSPFNTAKSPVNTKAGKQDQPYRVHPWIAAACNAKHSNWIPNPSRVQFYDAQAGILEPLDNCSEPNLIRGDLVKMSFRMVLTAGRSYWSCAMKPIQIVRVGHVAPIYGNVTQEEEPTNLTMPKPGDKIVLIARTEKGETREVGSPDWELEGNGDEGSESESKSGDSSTMSESGLLDGDSPKDEQSQEIEDGAGKEVPESSSRPSAEQVQGPGRSAMPPQQATQLERKAMRTQKNSNTSKRKRMEDDGEAKRRSQKRKA